MRLRAGIPLVAASLLGAACTNDYDALLDQGSGGASATSADTTTSTADATSTSSTTGVTTSTGTGPGSSSSTTSSGPGGAGGATGAGGGAGQGGQGGAGGASNELPGATPCALRLDLAPEDDVFDLPDGWDFGDGGASDAAITNGRFEVTFTDGDAYAELHRDLAEGELEGCSVATTVHVLPNLSSFDAGTTAVAYLAVKSGVDFLASVQLVRNAGDDGEVTMDVASTYVDNTPTDIFGPVAQTEALPTGLRIREFEGVLYFDLQLDGASWKQVAEADVASLEGPIDVVAFGAGRESPGGENDDFSVALGGLNAP